MAEPHLSGTVLVLAPWRRAVHLRRERLGTDQATEKPSAREQRTPARGARRGTSAATAGGGVPAERRSVAELGEMARTAGIRWRPEYATEGGARGLLEILRALENGTAPAEIAGPEPSLGPESGAGAGPAPAPMAAGEAVDSDTEEPAAPAWSPSCSSSVYTPTVLYGTEREEAAPADPEGSDVDETPEDGRAQR